MESSSNESDDEDSVVMWSTLRAQLSTLNVPSLRDYRAMVHRIGTASGNTSFTKRILRLVDYMIEEQADLHF